LGTARSSSSGCCHYRSRYRRSIWCWRACCRCWPFGGIRSGTGRARHAADHVPAPNGQCGILRRKGSSEGRTLRSAPDCAANRANYNRALREQPAQPISSLSVCVLIKIGDAREMFLRRDDLENTGVLTPIISVLRLNWIIHAWIIPTNETSLKSLIKPKISDRTHFTRK
jgi:hypothetical protein